MAIYKNDNGTWYVMIRYQDWTGCSLVGQVQENRNANEDFLQEKKLRTGNYNSNYRRKQAWI